MSSLALLRAEAAEAELSINLLFWQHDLSSLEKEKLYEITDWDNTSTGGPPDGIQQQQHTDHKFWWMAIWLEVKSNSEAR